MTCVLYQKREKKQVLPPHRRIIVVRESMCFVGYLIWKVDLGILPNCLPNLSPQLHRLGNFLYLDLYCLVLSL